MLILTTFFIQPETKPSTQEYVAEFILQDHPDPVGCLVWSLNDSMLLMSAENDVGMWNTKVILILSMVYTP